MSLRFKHVLVSVWKPPPRRLRFSLWFISGCIFICIFSDCLQSGKKLLAQSRDTYGKCVAWAMEEPIKF